MELMAAAGAERIDFESDISVEPEGGTVVQPTSVNGTVVAGLEEVLKSDEVKENLDNTASTTSNQNNPEVPLVEESDAGKRSTHSDPLDLVEYSSATELETLGLEKLKVELQARGLKCRGTLQERAARLFLLKTTPLDKLPKKPLAKPAAGRK